MGKILNVTISTSIPKTKRVLLILINLSISIIETLRPVLEWDIRLVSQGKEVSNSNRELHRLTRVVHLRSPALRSTNTMLLHARKFYKEHNSIFQTEKFLNSRHEAVLSPQMFLQLLEKHSQIELRRFST